MGEMQPPNDDEVDDALKLAVVGYDPDGRYPEYGNTSMREAYRAGWEDGRDA